MINVIPNFYFFLKNNNPYLNFFTLHMFKNNNLLIVFKNNNLLIVFKRVWISKIYKSTHVGTLNFNKKFNYNKTNFVFFNKQSYNLYLKNNKNIIHKTNFFFLNNVNVYNYFNFILATRISKFIFLNNILLTLLFKIKPLFVFFNKNNRTVRPIVRKNKNKSLLTFNLYLL